MLFSGIGVTEWKNKLKRILMDFPFQQVDGFLKIYLVEPRAKRLSHDDRSNIEVKQEFFMDFTLEMN